MVEDTNDHSQCFNGGAPLNLNCDSCSVTLLHAAWLCSINSYPAHISSRPFPVTKFNVLLLPAIVQ